MISMPVASFKTPLYICQSWLPPLWPAAVGTFVLLQFLICILYIHCTVLFYFRDSDGNAVDQDGVVAGIVTALDIPVRITNAAEDAFGARIAVTFNNVFNFIRAVPAETGNQVRHTNKCPRVCSMGKSS